MKRRDLIRQLREIATARGLTLEMKEGAKHTKVWIGERYQTIPRHNEVAERLAQTILRHMRGA